MFNEVINAKKNIFPMIGKGNICELRNEWFKKLWSNEAYEVYLIIDSQGLTQVNKKLNKETTDKSLRKILIKNLSDYDINEPRYIVVEKNDSFFIQDKKIVASNLFSNHKSMHFLDGSEDFPIELEIISILIFEINKNSKQFINNLFLLFFNNWREDENVEVYNYLLDNKIISYDNIFSTHHKRFPARIRNLFNRRFLNDPYSFLHTRNNTPNNFSTTESSKFFSKILNFFCINWDTIKLALEKDIHIRDFLPVDVIDNIMDRDFYYENIERHPEIAVHYTHKLTSMDEYYQFIDSNPNNIRFIPEFKGYIELWKRAIQLNPDCLIYAKERLLNYFADNIDINNDNIGYLFKYLSDNKKTKDIILYMISHHKIAFNDIPKHLLDDEIKIHVMKNIKNNSSLALTYVEYDPSAVQLFVEEIHKDYSLLPLFYPHNSILFNNIFNNLDLNAKKQYMILYSSFISDMGAKNMTLELYKLARGLNVQSHRINFDNKPKAELFEEELFLWLQNDIIKTRIAEIPKTIENIMQIDRTVKQLKQKKLTQS